MAQQEGEMKTTNKEKKSPLAYSLCLMAFLLFIGSTNTLADDQKSVANVKDTEGKTYKVQSLHAKYRAGGSWLGRRPEETSSSLKIVFSMTKDRVETTEEVEFEFAKLRRIVLKNADIPAEIKPTLNNSGRENIRIERRDGTVILLGNLAMIEVDANGKQIKRTDFNSYSFKAGEIQGQYITLDGFGGHSRTSDGKEGDFWITEWETASIEFE